MSKGLEALERIKTLSEARGMLNYPEIIMKFGLIENELKELEERREMMRRFNEACVPMILDNQTEKKFKALEIIKEKDVDVYYFRRCKDFDEYNYRCEKQEELTQEEFDLLEEELK